MYKLSAGNHMVHTMCTEIAIQRICHLSICRMVQNFDEGTKLTNFWQLVKIFCTRYSNISTTGCQLQFR